MIMKKRILTLILALAAALTLVACGNQETAAPEESMLPSAEPTETPEVYARIGVEAAGENVYTVKLTNRTGAEITAVSVKDDAAEEYPGNMLPEGEVFAVGETRELYYDATGAVEAAQAAETDPDAPVLTPAYSIRLTFADGTEQELHAFPFGDAESADIFSNGELIYVIYASMSTQETVNTLGAEQAVRDAAAAEEAQRQAEEAARQQAAQQAAWQAQQQQQQQTTEPDDGCVEDGIMY